MSAPLAAAARPAWTPRAEEPAPGVPLRALWTATFLAATVIGLVFGAQAVLLRVVRDQDPTIPTTVALQLLPWYGWALLVPVIVRLCERVPVRAERWGRALAVYGAAAVVLTLVHTALISPPTIWLDDPPWARRPLWMAFQHLIINRAAGDLVSVCLLVAACSALLYHRTMRDRELAASHLAARLAEAELRALKMQVQPHFLFNTLNAIAAHVRDEPEVAEAMVERLSELLRLVLHRAPEHEVTLRREMEIVRHYLAIHEVRYGGRLAVEYRVPPELEGALVPTMLLQPLVENAVAYGVARHGGPAWVAVEARAEDGMLIVGIRNSGGRAAGEAGSGIGLSNTRARLRQMFGERQRLDLVHDGRESRVTVAVPLRGEDA